MKKLKNHGFSIVYIYLANTFFQFFQIFWGVSVFFLGAKTKTIEKTEKNNIFHRIYPPAKYCFFLAFSCFFFSVFHFFLIAKTKTTEKTEKTILFHRINLPAKYGFFSFFMFSVSSVLAIICLTTNLQPNPAIDKKQKESRECFPSNTIFFLCFLVLHAKNQWCFLVQHVDTYMSDIVVSATLSSMKKAVSTFLCCVYACAGAAMNLKLSMSSLFLGCSMNLKLKLSRSALILGCSL